MKYRKSLSLYQDGAIPQNFELWDEVRLTFMKRLLVERNKLRQSGEAQCPHRFISIMADTSWVAVDLLYMIRSGLIEQMEAAHDIRYPGMDSNADLFERVLEGTVHYHMKWIGPTYDDREFDDEVEIALGSPSAAEPPSFWVFVAALGAPPHRREEVLGDLDEQYAFNLKHFGEPRARFMMAWDVSRSIAGRVYRVSRNQVVDIVIRIIKKFME